jgi:hypothetical protein
MDPAIFGTMSMPDVQADESGFESTAWFNERHMETAESLYNSMINHTSPPAESTSDLQEPHAKDVVAHSIETADSADYANTGRNLALEAMATAADALLDPALLETPIKDMNIAPSPNFEVVEGKVVPWGSISSGDDQEPTMNGWHISGTEEQVSHAHNELQAAASYDQRGREDNGVYRTTNNKPASAPTVEAQGVHFQQPRLEQDVKMADIDPLLEEANGDLPEYRPELLRPYPTEQVDSVAVEMNAEADIAPAATTLAAQPPSTFHSGIPASPVLANGFISPITPRAISPETDIPAISTPVSNAELASSERANSKRHSARQSKPVDRFTVESATTHAEKKCNAAINGAVKSTSPQSMRKPARSKTPGKTPIKLKATKTEAQQAPLMPDFGTVPEADEDTMKLIEQMRQEDLGLRRRRAS